MDWPQTLTIILTIGPTLATVLYISKEDIKVVREDIKRHDEEFSRVHALWANLLEEIRSIEKQILEIKLDQSKNIPKL